MSSKRPLARGDVVLVSFPFTDLSAQKVRPALIVGRLSDDDDVILAFISSNTSTPDPQVSCVLRSNDPEFGQTGLKVPSLIRLNKVAPCIEVSFADVLATSGRRPNERSTNACGMSLSYKLQQGLFIVTLSAAKDLHEPSQSTRRCFDKLSMTVRGAQHDRSTSQHESCADFEKALRLLAIH